MTVNLTKYDREFLLRQYDETVRVITRSPSEADTVFDPKNPRVPITGKVLDADDYRAMIEAVLEGHLTHGKHAEEFERALAKQFGLRCAAFCNSGSSANLLALAALMQPEFAQTPIGNRKLNPGDEIVTCAAGFPTTVNPIVQLGLVPVFVDCELGTYTPRMDQVAEALTRDRAKVFILAHTLGNPFDGSKFSDEVNKRPDKHAFFIEDCCDALGSLYNGMHVGSLADIATCSFYPAHHITTGEGGAVLTQVPFLDKIIRSLRDWGRSCWCPTGKDNTCGKRFDSCVEYKFVHNNCDSPLHGYDHKHVFSRVGWNLKATDIQAALGVTQLRKLPQFSATRRRNWRQLRTSLEDLQDRIILPEATPGSDPCWFGFAITVRSPLQRRDVIQHLESKGVATRPIFAGNITRQPAYRRVKYEVVGTLENADRVMRDSFYVGCWHGLTEKHIAWSAKVIREAVTR